MDGSKWENMLADWLGFAPLISLINYLFYYHTHTLTSCVALNSLGRAKKYIEVSGRPGVTEFLSAQYSNHLDRYNLTFKIESLPDLDEIKLLYRKLMVISLKLFVKIVTKLSFMLCIH